MHVPFLDLAAAYRELAPDLDAATQRVMSSGRYILGPEVEAFEREFAAYCGVRNCVGVGSGLDALTLILRALGVGPGDEVIVPGNTFIATWFAVSHVGATPVPADPLVTTHQLDPDRVAERINSRTRAIVAVHLYGMPAEIERLASLAESQGLELIEDAAQAHGARYLGRRCGSLGHAAGFSFYPGKNLGASGDGGAVTTDDDRLAERIRLLRNYGSHAKYAHEIDGWNSRLDELQAAWLRIRLQRLDEWNRRRAAVADAYGRALADVDAFRLPETTPGAEPVWHQYVIDCGQRDALQAALATEGVETLIHYPIAPHKSGAYAEQRWPPLPNSDYLADRVLSLPVGPHLTCDAVETVLEALLKADRHGVR